MGYLDTKSSTGITDLASKLSGYSHDGYTVLWTHAKQDYCSDFSHYTDTVRGTETCKSLDEYGTLLKEYCGTGDNITKTSCGESILTSYGFLDIYNELAEKFCKEHKGAADKEFCKCYNVTNYETVCANRGTSAGCPAAKEVYDKYVEFKIPDPNVYLPCGKACTGNVYKPSGYNAGCDGTINACVMSIEIGESNDEVNAACNIDSTSGLSSGGSDGSGGSGDASGSGGSTSVPLSTTQTSDLEKTVAEMKKQKEEEEEEAKKTNKKLLIGGGGGIVSSISCLILIVLIVMVMSKKGGGGRR